jgi:branched-chain amino acid transport system permease protein
LHKFVNFTLDGLTTGAIYAAMAMALVLIWRATRIVNFAQGAMAMLTTYIAFSITDSGGEYWVAFAVALVSGLIIGAVIERTLVRPIEGGPPLNAVILTLGLLLLIEAIAPMIFGGQIHSFPAAFSITGVEIGGSRVALSPFDIFTIAAVLGVMLALLLLFQRTGVGLRMRASAFDPRMARLLGVRVGRTLTFGWALAAMVGSLAGILITPNVLLSPHNMDEVLVFAFTAAILGGLDSPIGAAIGGVLTGLVLSYVGGYISTDLEVIGAFIVLVTVLMVRPEGLLARQPARRV